MDTEDEDSDGIEENEGEGNSKKRRRGRTIISGSITISASGYYIRRSGGSK
jgi:hypothetical protein